MVAVDLGLPNNNPITQLEVFSRDKEGHMFPRRFVASLKKMLFFTVPFISISIQCSSAEEKTAWVVESSKIRCVLDNISAYRNSKNDPVIIYLDACPEADRVAALEKLAGHSAIPVIPRQAQAQNIPQRVIVYTKSELECLSRQALDTTHALTRLPRTPCEAGK